MKNFRIILLCLLAVFAPGLAGCRRSDSTAQGKIAVFADSSLHDAFSELAGDYRAAHGGSVDLICAESDSLLKSLEAGEKADLVALKGPSVSEPEEHGLYPGAQDIKRLEKEKYIDNFCNFASDGKDVCSVTKPIKSRAYAGAQKFVDLLQSGKGKEILKKYGFSPF